LIFINCVTNVHAKQFQDTQYNEQLNTYMKESKIKYTKYTKYRTRQVVTDPQTNKLTNPQTHTQTDRTNRLQNTAPLSSHACWKQKP